MLREKRRIAFYGGTFDPFHCGHLEMARAAQAALRLQRVYFVPARQNPHKASGPCASDGERLEMIRLSIDGEPDFGIWEGELEREGPSYTLESVRYIERVYPNSHLFWIIGSDQLAGLAGWYGIDQLAGMVGFILVRRPGFELNWPGIPGLRVYLVDNPPVPVSATSIRGRIRAGQPLEGMVAPAVEAFIRARNLYR